MNDRELDSKLKGLFGSLPSEEVSPETRRKLLRSLDQGGDSQQPSGERGRAFLLAAAALFLFVLIASAVFLPMLWPYRDQILDHPRDRGMVMDTVSSERG